MFSAEIARSVPRCGLGETREGLPGWGVQCAPVQGAGARCYPGRGAPGLGLESVLLCTGWKWVTSMVAGSGGGVNHVVGAVIMPRDQRIQFGVLLGHQLRQILQGEMIFKLLACFAGSKC